MLESLEQSNIKRMSIEEPEINRTEWFSWHEEITLEDQEMILNDIQKYRTSETWDHYSEYVSDLYNLGIKFEINQYEKTSIVNRLKALSQHNEWLIFAHIARNIKDMGIKPDISDYEKMQLTNSLESSRKEFHGSMFFADLAACMKDLSIAFDITELDKARISKDLQLSRDIRHYDRLARTAVNMQKLGIRPDITTEDQQNMLSTLRFQKTLSFDTLRLTSGGGKWRLFVHLASDMNRLSKSSLRDVSSGMEAPSVPEQKQF